MKPGDIVTPVLSIRTIGYETYDVRPNHVWYHGDVIVLIETVSIRIMPLDGNRFITGWKVMEPNGSIAFVSDSDIFGCEVVVRA